MNKTIKSIITGILAGLITVCAVPAIADSIEALKNSVNISLNGEDIASIDENYILQNGAKVPYSILYEGTTYLPVRKLSELINVEIGWDNDTRTVLINTKEDTSNIEFDSWYGVPDFGEVNGIKELDQTTTVRSTTHWYEIKNIKDNFESDYIEELEALGFKRVVTGSVKPKFRVYSKGKIEVWLDLGMYTKLVYGVTVVDTTRPIVGRTYSYNGSNEDIPSFASAFGFTSTSIGGVNYYDGDWHLWAYLPDYFQLLDSEGFKISTVGKGFYGKMFTLKKDRSTVVIKFDGTSNSNIPVVTIDY